MPDVWCRSPEELIPCLQKFRTYALALEFYRDCKQLRVSPVLRSQLLRAVSSIVLNLAEGSAKPTAKERARFYSIAFASFRECQAILSLESQRELLLKHDPLGGCLYKLSRSSN